MLFPSSVLCNEAGQGVLRQKVRNAVNQLNRDWNFCSYFADGKNTLIVDFCTFIVNILQIKLFLSLSKVPENVKNWISM